MVNLALSAEAYYAVKENLINLARVLLLVFNFNCDLMKIRISLRYLHFFIKLSSSTRLNFFITLYFFTNITILDINTIKKINNNFNKDFSSLFKNSLL